MRYTGVYTYSTKGLRSSLVNENQLCRGGVGWGGVGGWVSCSGAFSGCCWFTAAAAVPRVVSSGGVLRLMMHLARSVDLRSIIEEYQHILPFMSGNMMCACFDRFML